MPSQSTSSSSSSSDTEEKGRRSRYERTKQEFGDMSVEEQASFLIEASATALARGLEHAGRRVAEEMESMFGERRHRSSGREDARPGAAEPETSQRKASR